MKKSLFMLSFFAAASVVVSYAEKRYPCEHDNLPPNQTVWDTTETASHYHVGEDISGRTFSTIMYWYDLSSRHVVQYGMGGDFSNATAVGTSFSGVTFVGTNFNGANLTNASFAGTRGAYNISLANATITNASFSGSDIKAANLESSANFSATKNMSGINLSNISNHLLFSDASGMNFSNVKFDGAYIGQNNFENSDFTNASFVGCNIEGTPSARTSFLGATLKNADFTNATITYSSFDSAFTKEQLSSTASLKNKYLAYVNFDGNDFSGVDFSGANLIESKLKNVNLDGAKFVNAHGLSETYSTILEGAVITNADFSRSDISAKTLEQTKSYADRNFSGVNLSGISGNYIKFTDASGFDFTNAVFDNSNFGGNNFENSDFTNASFVGTNLKGTASQMTSFLGAKLDGTNFAGAKISYTKFDSAFTKEQLQSTAEFTSNKYFYGTSFTDNDFSGVNLRDALFSDSASLANVNLSHTNLQNAKFYTCTVENADLTGSDLRGAQFFNSSLFDSSTKKNTIMSDGTIEGFSMSSAADSFSIAKHITTSTVINAKISQSDASISGGAILTLENGAKLDILNGKTLTVENGGEILVNTSSDDPAAIFIGADSGIEFSDGGILSINVSEDIVGTDIYTYAIMSWEDSSAVDSLEKFISGSNLLLAVNGKDFAGNWKCFVDKNTLSVALQIPEPSTYACIFGAAALLVCAARRRK